MSNLEQLLKNSGYKQKGKKWQCPAHEDKNPSADLLQGDDGEWRLHCKACGWWGNYYDCNDKIMKQPQGTTWKESTNVTETKKSPHICSKEPEKKQRIYSIKEIEGYGTAYKYGDGQVDMVSLRRDNPDGGKSFALYRKCDGGFVTGGLPVLPLYNQSRIKGAETVVVVEGEKCVRALHDKNIVATTKPCGAQAPEKADWTPLYGKTVVLWPDKDPPGIKYMNQVKDLLTPHCRVKWIDPPEELPYKGDAFDYCMTTNNVQDLIDNAKSCGASSEVIDFVEDVIEGRLREAEWRHSSLTSLTNSLIPGSTTLFVGGGGTGKSLFLTENCIHWMEHGVEWIMYALESDRRTHMLRALAMKVGESRMTRMSWIRNNPKEVRRHYEDHKDWMDDFGSRIVVPPLDIGQKELAEWMAKQDKRIIIIDPISIANQDLHAQSWESDKLFIKRTEEVGKNTNTSIINVSHPKAEGCRPALDNIKGSMSWPNFTHNVLWMESIKPETVTCLTGVMNLDFHEEECEINKKLHILKARNGETAYSTAIGYRFGGEKNEHGYVEENLLTFTEKGVIK